MNRIQQEKIFTDELSVLKKGDYVTITTVDQFGIVGIFGGTHLQKYIQLEDIDQTASYDEIALWADKVVNCTFSFTILEPINIEIIKNMATSISSMVVKPKLF